MPVPLRTIHSLPKSHASNLIYNSKFRRDKELHLSQPEGFCLLIGEEVFTLYNLLELFIFLKKENPEYLLSNIILCQ